MAMGWVEVFGPFFGVCVPSADTAVTVLMVLPVRGSPNFLPDPDVKSDVVADAVENHGFLLLTALLPMMVFAMFAARLSSLRLDPGVACCLVEGCMSLLTCRCIAL